MAASQKSSTSISIATKLGADATEVFMEGRLNVTSAPDAEKALDDIASASTAVILDLSELEYISSAGLRAIKRLHKTLKKKGGTLHVRNVRPDVFEIFEITGFSAILNIVD